MKTKSFIKSLKVSLGGSMDCPICTSAKGLKDRQELVQHMEIHRDNPELMIEKIL
ncbi:MAG: hypothetical protein WAK17_29610 [Candidatus Nitrosopolaris sp.]